MSFIQHIKPSVQKLEAYSLKSAPFSPDLIKLNQNENPFDLPDTIKREIVEDFFLQQWNRYPEVLPLKLIEEISKYLSISEESIIAANGSNELMYTILMAIVSKGTKVLIPIRKQPHLPRSSSISITGAGRAFLFTCDLAKPWPKKRRKLVSSLGAHLMSCSPCLQAVEFMPIVYPSASSPMKAYTLASKLNNQIQLPICERSR